MERWVNKTAVVTGASAGIGAAVCVSLANAGLRVVGLARRPELIDELNANVSACGSISSRKCNVSQAGDIKSAFKWIDDTFGGTDILINNAAVLFFPGNITDLGGNQTTEEEITATIDTNFKGVILCTQYAISSMKKRSFDGHIVNVNSIAGHYIPTVSGYNVYASTKHAVGAFTSSLLCELANFNNKIKVTSVSPGLVKTYMAEQHCAAAAAEGPILMPSDVADAILYVLSTPPNVNISELTIASVAEKIR